MENFWNEYKKNVQNAINTHTAYTLSFATAHVLWVKFGLKEACDVFGSFGISNFVVFSLTFIFVGPLIRTYLESKK